MSERKCVIAAFGDILGFGAWTRRASNSPEVSAPFVQMFYALLENYVLSNPRTYVKYVGDGLMIIKEIPLGNKKNRCINQFLQGLVKLTLQAQDLIKGCAWPPPDGFRMRVTSGHVSRLNVLDPGNKRERVPEYVGYAVNLAQRLLEVSPTTSCICHESVVKLLGSRKNPLHFKRLGDPKERPRGIDSEDLGELWMLQLERRARTR